LLRVMTRETKEKISQYKSMRWKDFLYTMQKTHDRLDKVFWTHLSRIFKPRTLPFSKLAVGNKVLSGQQEINDELYKYYSEQFKAPQLDYSDAYDVKIEVQYIELMNKLALSDVQVEKTTMFEITRYIKKLKPKKSAGVDLVSNFIIKRLPPGYIECLVNCFNVWLSECRYPNHWKLAKIVTLNKLKAGVPRCDQTRPISLLAAHSKLFEKIMLERIRTWAESNKLVPPEQSGFRPNCLLPARVLSIYQEIKNNMAANLPTLAIYVDYQKAYDRVWHMGLLTKLFRLGMSVELLKITESWLNDRQAYVVFGETTSKEFHIYIGLPQGSSLSPYLFVVFHCDLILSTGAHSSHLFADDLSVLITPPIQKELGPMVAYLTKEGTKVCNQISAYSKRWKQPINVSKTVAQLFYPQVKTPLVNITMEGQKIEMMKEFRYLGFTWTNKLSLKPTVDRCLENMQRSLGKLKWLRGGRTISMVVLRQVFFAYTFPHLVWLFPFYPFLPKTQQNLLNQKFRVGLRLVHRCPYVSAQHLFSVTKEDSLDQYVKKYIQKRLKKMHVSDLGASLFYKDVFYWDDFVKRKQDNMGHFFRLRRVQKLRKRHESLLIKWLDFVDIH
jgi:hypothetical protein